ncbi:hypothetical protein AKJ09_09296 [Labilithrix luteola]|uniref:Uncharacterized protein n=1 Tax=Labilithrix luteola TaxID=1391654 RepID=A0A0K1QA73_9BACT|nr:hypothetical protein AKJ09_09296 [Labilithrix luteola]
MVLHRSNAYLHTRIVGHFDMDLANVLIGTLEDWMGSQRGVVAFHDCVKLENYDVEARERITTWSRTRVDRFDGVHLLVEGRIIGWALRLVSVAIGGKLTTHYDRAAFEGVIARRRNVARPDR